MTARTPGVDPAAHLKSYCTMTMNNAIAGDLRIGHKISMHGESPRVLRMITALLGPTKVQLMSYALPSRGFRRHVRRVKEASRRGAKV